MVLHRLKPGKEEMKKTTKAIAKTNRNLKKEQGHEKDDASLARPVVGIARSLTKSRLGSAAAEQVTGWEKVLHVNVYTYVPYPFGYIICVFFCLSDAKDAHALGCRGCPSHPVAAHKPHLHGQWGDEGGH